MEQKRYVQYRKELSFVSPSDAKAFVHILIFLGLLLGGIVAARSEIHLLSVILLIAAFFNGQILMHELGHGFFFKTRLLNTFFGNLVALAPIIPYRSWELIHGQHHRWSGNKFRDPTMTGKDVSELDEKQRKIINFCWRFWIPIFALSYSIRIFWNLKELDRLFPDHGTGLRVGIIIPLVVYGALFWYFPMGMLTVWLPAYYVFMAISEPILFSQHVHVDQGDARFEEFSKDSSYHVAQQDIFSRTLVFPRWFSKWIMLGFNQHALHHVFPNLPSYEYHRVSEEFVNTVDWKEWYKFAKRTDAITLLFMTNKDTNLIEGQV